MIKLENIEVTGWEHAIRGMRNPMNSWERSDSKKCPGFNCDGCDFWRLDSSICSGNHLDGEFVIGQNDLNLMKQLRNAGTDHRKFMRMIVVYMDITAPLYWWKEFDTYKVGTVANSCSTMHKIAEKNFTIDDFSYEHLMAFWDQDIPYSSNETSIYDFKQTLIVLIETLNVARRLYLETKDKTYWWQMIQLLPSSYNQRRTVMLNYEVLVNIYKSRKDHKLDEWQDFCREILKLPYGEVLIAGEGKEDINNE